MSCGQPGISRDQPCIAMFSTKRNSCPKQRVIAYGSSCQLVHPCPRKLVRSCSACSECQYCNYMGLLRPRQSLQIYLRQVQLSLVHAESRQKTLS